MRILLIGDGPGATTLRHAYEAMGAEVRVCQVPDGIAGLSPSAIIVDDLLAEVERVIVDGTSSHMSAAGLIASLPLEFDTQIRQFDPSPALYGRPRPYLKRKKGRP
jgi:hypothetical protein